MTDARRRPAPALQVLPLTDATCPHIGQWRNERTQIVSEDAHSRERLTTGALYADYCAWSRESGHSPDVLYPVNKFSTWLARSRPKLKQSRQARGTTWAGIALVRP